jgi:hypothetical protein
MSDTTLHKNTTQHVSETTHTCVRHMLCCACLCRVVSDACGVVFFVHRCVRHMLWCVCLCIVVSDTCCAVFLLCFSSSYVANFLCIGCYFYVETPMAYDDAVIICASMNGELVKIDRAIIQLKMGWSY